MKNLGTLAAATLMPVLAGCTHHYVPRTATYDFPGIPHFESANAIELINVQPTSEPAFFGTAGIRHKWYGDLRQWTDAAIAITDRELGKRKMAVRAGSKKTLKLAVVSIKATSGGWGFRGYASLQATTSNGYERVFDGNSPAATITRSADGAVMQAVAAMLADEKIRSYLLEPEK